MTTVNCSDPTLRAKLKNHLVETYDAGNQALAPAFYKAVGITDAQSTDEANLKTFSRFLKGENVSQNTLERLFAQFENAPDWPEALKLAALIEAAPRNCLDPSLCSAEIRVAQQGSEASQFHMEIYFGDTEFEMQGVHLTGVDIHLFYSDFQLFGDPDRGASQAPLQPEAVNWAKGPLLNADITPGRVGSMSWQVRAPKKKQGLRDKLETDMLEARFDPACSPDNQGWLQLVVTACGKDVIIERVEIDEKDKLLKALMERYIEKTLRKKLAQMNKPYVLAADAQNLKRLDYDA